MVLPDTKYFSMRLTISKEKTEQAYNFLLQYIGDYNIYCGEHVSIKEKEHIHIIFNSDKTMEELKQFLQDNINSRTQSPYKQQLGIKGKNIMFLKEAGDTDKAIHYVWKGTLDNPTNRIYTNIPEYILTNIYNKDYEDRKKNQDKITFIKAIYDNMKENEIIKTYLKYDDYNPAYIIDEIIKIIHIQYKQKTNYYSFKQEHELIINLIIKYIEEMNDVDEFIKQSNYLKFIKYKRLVMLGDYNKMIINEIFKSNDIV